jgi:hypothetical protein
MRIKVLYSSSYPLLTLEESLITALQDQGYTFHSKGYDPNTLNHVVYFDCPVRKETSNALNSNSNQR